MEREQDRGAAARVLFQTWPSRGHVNPLIGVAQQLKQAGCEVGWVFMPHPGPLAAQLASSNIEAIALPGMGTFQSRSGQDLARIVRDPVEYPKRIRSHCLEIVQPAIEPSRQRIREFRPDVLVLDGQVYAGVIAAHLESVPSAALCTSLLLAEPPGFDSDFRRIVDGLQAERAEMFARYGLPNATFSSVEYLSPWLNAMFATDALVGDAPLPPATHLVGPSIPPQARGDEVPFPFEQLDRDRPIVYASFGSLISWQPELFAKIAEAAAPLGVQLVLSAGDLAGTDFARKLPGTVCCMDYVPQLAVLERAAAFITHGGANSVMEAMYCGVPTLVVPMCRDQPLQGMFVERAGAGRVIAPDALTVEACRSALQQLLDPQGAHRRATDAIRASYRTHDGAKTTAEMIIAMVSSMRTRKSGVGAT